MITNPTPITASVFSGMWISSLSIMLPSKNLIAAFLPYDGEHILATGRKNISSVISSDISPLVSKVKSIAGKTVEPKLIQVMAPDPSKPVFAQVVFADGTVGRITDCYALCATDAEFAAIFQQTMGIVASLGGYSIN